MVEHTSRLKPLDDLLGTGTKVAVLRLLCANRRDFSGREIARRVGRNAAHVHATLRELLDAGLLESERVGNVHLFRAREGNLWIERVLAPMFESEARLERRLWRDLVQAAGPTLRSMVLFGSRARGDHGPGSDLDLLVVVAETANLDDVRYAILETGMRYGLSAEATMVSMDQLPRWARHARELWENILAEGLAIAGLDLGELKLHVGRGEPRPRRGVPEGCVAQS